MENKEASQNKQVREIKGGGGGRSFGQIKSAKKAKEPTKVLKRLLGYVGKYKIIWLVVIVCIILDALIAVAGSLFLRIVIDDYIAPILLMSSPYYGGLLKAIFTMGLIYLAGIVVTVVYTQLMVVVTQGTMKKIRDDMFSKMQKLPIKYFDTHNHGDIMSRYTNDTDTLSQMISQSIPSIISSIMTIVATLVSMIYLSVPLTMIVLMAVVVMFLVVKILGSKSGDYFVKQQKAIGKVNGYIEEMIEGQKIVKVFCYEEKAKAGFNDYNEDWRVNAQKANILSTIIMPIMGNIGNIVYVLIAVVGGYLALGKVGLSLGAIASFLQLSRMFFMPISRVSQQLNSIIMALAGGERIFDLLDEKEEVDDGKVTLVKVSVQNDKYCESEKDGLWAWKVPEKNGAKYVLLKGDVRFNDVCFGYNSEKIILEDIDLFADSGQKVAFVGATGAGKTTITNLINRFYDINSGEILYDGINVLDIKKDDLRKSLGIVLQDTNLFSATVKENIRFGKIDATDEEVYSAAKLANADEFIKLLPNGYDTFISGNGGSLSQGQRQLLAIARAAIANAPVMILDEATSSIDTRTESIVQKGMDSLMKGRSVFVIAHRLSTVHNADVIMVLENGKIIERGNHERLMEEKGKYFELYNGALLS